MTEYRDIEGFPGYRIGNDGSVWTSWYVFGTGRARPMIALIGGPWKRMQAPLGKDGYRSVNLTLGGGRKRRRRVHRLVLHHFCGACPDGMEACHNNGNCLDNRAENLRWDTRKANARDRVRHRLERLSCIVHA